MQVSESVGNLTVAVLVDRARRLAPLAGVTGEHVRAAWPRRSEHRLLEASCKR
jgi:hypothetical protein